LVRLRAWRSAEPKRSWQKTALVIGGAASIFEAIKR
jgi:hypothetical protein